MKLAEIHKRNLFRTRGVHAAWSCLVTSVGIVLCLCVSFGAAKAQSIITPIVEVDKGDAQTLLAEARAKDRAGLSAEAITLYRRAATLETDGVIAYRELAAVLARNSATHLEAESIYDKLTVILPRDAALAVARAENFSRAGESVKAALHFRRASDIAPDNEAALSGYIREMEKLGAVPVAIEQHATALATTPRNVAAQLRLAELLRSDGAYNEALSHYWIVQRLAPQNAVALRGIAESWLGLGYTSRAAEAFSDAARRGGREISVTDAARLLLASGRPSAALKLLSQRAAQLNAEPSALIVLADANRALDDHAGERKALERLLAVARTPDADTLERLARVAHETGDREAARGACERLLALDARNAVAAVGLHLLGTRELPPVPTEVTSEQSGHTNRDEADQSTAKLARRARFDRALGEAALFWNQPRLAKIYLQRAATVWWRSPRLLSALATAFRRSGDSEAAVAAYTRTDFKDGRSPNALLGWAETEMMRDNTRQALAIYRDVSQLDPANLHARAGEAEVIRRGGGHTEAAALFAELVRRAPEEARFGRYLTETLTELGRGWADASPAAPLIGARDMLHVKVGGKLRFDGETRLDDAAVLRLPFLSGEINARCLTENELAIAIAARSQTPLEARDVTVQIVAFERVPLTVAGAVYLPNIFYVRDKLSLRQGLMLASGATDRAADIVYVVRGAGACLCRSANRVAPRVESYSRTSIEGEGESAAEPLQPGDTVFVPDAAAVFIHGAVPRRGGFVLSGGATLLQLVRRLGEPLDKAERGRVALTRVRNQGAARQKFIVDLSDIEQGRVGDVILQPGDVLEVPSRANDACELSFAATLNQIAADEVSGANRTYVSEPLSRQ